MNTWLSNFIIENLRTEIVTDARMPKHNISGTISSSDHPLPYLFKPIIQTIDYDYHFRSPIFQNEYFIIDITNNNFKEVEFIISGLKANKDNSTKTLILISTVMTWARTGNKIEDDVEK